MEYPQIEDSHYLVTGYEAYQICMKVLNSPISPNISINCLVSRSPVCNPDVPAANYFIVLCRLGMVQGFDFVNRSHPSQPLRSFWESLLKF